MTIEEQLERIAVGVERMVHILEHPGSSATSDSTTTVEVEAKVETPKKKRGRPAKKKKEKVAVEEHPEVTVIPLTEEELSEEPKLTEDDVAEDLRKVITITNKERAVGLLNEFGASKVSDIPTNQYSEFSERAKEICNG